MKSTADFRDGDVGFSISNEMPIKIGEPNIFPWCIVDA